MRFYTKQYANKWERRVNPIKSKPSSSKRNIKEVIKGIFRTFELLLGIFFVIIGAELFLFVHEETVFGVVFFLIGVGFLLSFIQPEKEENWNRLTTIKGVTKVRDERRKEKKERS